MLSAKLHAASYMLQVKTRHDVIVFDYVNHLKKSSKDDLDNTCRAAEVKPTATVRMINLFLKA
jgi:hypothetical protein